MRYGRCNRTGRQAKSGICPLHHSLTCVTWVDSDIYPVDGWVHATNAARFPRGRLFAWVDSNKRRWTGIVSEADANGLRVHITDILPGAIER